MSASLVFAALAVAGAVLPHTAEAQTRLFQNPTLDGYAIDRCRSLNADCDWPAADAFCQSQGFTHASDWTWAYKATTVTVATRQVCETGPGMTCGGFLDITCASSGAPIAPQPGTEPTATGPAATPPPGDSTPADGSVTFSGNMHDYLISGDPATGGWTVTDIRPGAPDGTVQVPPDTPVLHFADGTLDGSGAQPGTTGAQGPAATIPGTETAIPDTPDQPAPAAPPTGLDADSFASGMLLYRIERQPYDCREGGKIGQKFVHCKVTYALENTSGAPIYWSHGEWETLHDSGRGMDRRGIGYRHAAIQPGATESYTVWCTIPDGYGQGSWGAWGEGYHKSNPNVRIPWALTTTCP